jgi:hypothetical protein
MNAPPRLTMRAAPAEDPRVLRLRRSIVVLAALALAGCGSSTEPAPANPIPVGALVPNFGLLDVNPASPTAGRVVSPRDFEKRVSAWYFGHST